MKRMIVVWHNDGQVHGWDLGQARSMHASRLHLPDSYSHLHSHQPACQQTTGCRRRKGKFKRQHSFLHSMTCTGWHADSLACRRTCTYRVRGLATGKAVSSSFPSSEQRELCSRGRSRYTRSPNFVFLINFQFLEFWEVNSTTNIVNYTYCT